MECKHALQTITYAAEGNDDPSSRFFSRRAHVPTDSSGITLGRGYDLSTKTEAQIETDLRAAGFAESTITLAKLASRYRGEKARRFLRQTPLPLVTSEQQNKLFCRCYEAAEKDVKRISAKPDVIARYGKLDWQKLDPAITEVLVDMRFRGDYTSSSRTVLQSAAAQNDKRTFRGLLSRRSLWKNVPVERFKARRNRLSGPQ